MENNKKKALILGGSGLIGGALAEELVKSFDVSVIDLKKPQEKINGVKYITANALSFPDLEELILNIKPELIINSINIATIFSSNPESNYKKLVKFYYNLYQTFCKAKGKLTYIQMGTTGSGGLGFNIPFTHGDKIDDLPIINKAAFAGVSTSMLTLMSRSFGHRVKVSEIKPGLAIFRTELVNKKINDSNLVLIDGGESGHYTYNELALLTHYMGFTTVDTIVDKVIKVLKGDKNFHNHCVHDTIGSMNGAIIKQNHLDHWRLTRYLSIMKKLSGKDYVIATGKLGPPSITRDLILCYFKKNNPEVNEENFSKSIQAEKNIKNTLKYIEKSDKSLHDYLMSEINFQNYSNVPFDADEPWLNVRNLLKSIQIKASD